jgi:ubiquinone/menaquinone biosynthesis C-methylase UbiE
VSINDRPWERWDDPGIADAIDRHWRRLPFEGEHRALLADVVARHASASCRLLEVGCGSGYFYEHLVTRLPDISYTGVDTSREMLALATARYPAVRFQHGDAFALDFEDDAFDVVVAFEVLGHLPDVTVPLREMHRVAAMRLLFSVWEGEEPRDLHESIAGSRFLHRVHTQAGLLDTLRLTGVGPEAVERVPISGAVAAYVVAKTHPREIDRA